MDISQANFTNIKQNIIDKYKNNSTFSDYNFDGSALNTILDILSYVTYFSLAHSNLALAETFIDSAIKRSSVVSRAYELGYIPRSKTAPSAILNVSFEVDGNPSEYVIPSGTKFTTSFEDATYTFSTIQSYIVENESNSFSETLTIYQGSFFDYEYVKESETTKFIIPSKDCDTRFLTVQVNGENYTYFRDLENIGNINSETRVYFLKENVSGYFEIFFGDDVIGKKPEIDNVISISYFKTSGDLANSTRSFSLSSTLNSVTNFSISVTSSANGGADIESIDSVQFLAPFYYSSMNRAVTINDYISIVKQNFPEISDVSVWGGEDNVPATPGRVYLAIKPQTGSIFSNAKKEEIKTNILNKYSSLTITPEIVDLIYMDVSVNVVSTYDSKRYSSSSNLETLIRNSITSFFNESVNKFGKNLRYSNLLKAIDNSSDLILSSVLNLNIERFEEIFSGNTATYEFSFNNSIFPGSLQSNVFIIDNIEYRMKDDKLGRIQIYRETNDGNIITLNSNIGTVNYENGEVSITAKIDSIVNDSVNNYLRINISQGTVQTENYVFRDNNVYTNSRDQIIRLADTNITILPGNT